MRPRFIILVIALIVFSQAGCSVIHIPNYIKDENPYKRTFYAPYTLVHELTVQALEKHGWSVEGESNPALFERSREVEGAEYKQTLLYTQIRKLSLVLGMRLTRINVYLRTTADSATEVEVRYVTVTTTSVKTFYNYKNDKAVNAILQSIEDLLTQFRSSL